jgi:hypothetical protein
VASALGQGLMQKRPTIEAKETYRERERVGFVRVTRREEGRI